MTNWRHRFRVYFEDTPPRDMYAQSAATAMRSGSAIERMMGTPRRSAQARHAEDLGHVGTDAAYCPLCRSRAPDLFGAPQQSAPTTNHQEPTS
jgi:hypothetical protein